MKLKPCPFCGQEAATAYYSDNIKVKIFCLNRDCFLWHDRNYYREDKETTVNRWNTRAGEPAEEKTAHWDINCDGYYPFCSHCGEAAERMSPHCPNCGAKMITRE